MENQFKLPSYYQKYEGNIIVYDTLTDLEKLQNNLIQVKFFINDKKHQTLQNSLENYLEILENFKKPLKQLKVMISEKNNDINLIYLNHVADFISSHFIKELVQFSQNIIQNNKLNIVKFKKNQIIFKLYFKNFEFLIDKKFWERSARHSLQDILCQIPNSERWKKIQGFLEYRNITDVVTLTKSLKTFLHITSLTNVMCYKSRKIKNKVFREIFEVLVAGYYIFFKNKTKKVTQQFLSDPLVDVAIRTWNGLDKVTLMRNWLKWQIILLHVTTHQKCYIPRFFQSLSLELITQQLKNGTFQKLNQDKIIRRNPIDLDIYKKCKNEKVKVRILCGENLIQYKKKENLLSQFTPRLIKNYFKNPKKQNKIFEEVIIHIHGGGWCAMSSYSHQCYTRKWARSKELKNVPIFSIDYRKTPYHSYPDSMDDCWQIYLFIVYEVHNYFNIESKRIILAGDSAGANMCLGIAFLCIKHNVRVPDGLLICYPALNLEQQFTPSLLVTFTDIIAPFPFLEICLEKYLSDKRCDPSKDPLLSPIKYTDEIIKLLPPMRIYVGENDCLLDESIRFLEKVVQAQHKDIKLVIYNMLRHGFLCWDIILAMPETYKCGEDAAQSIREMLDNSKLKK